MYFKILSYFMLLMFKEGVKFYELYGLFILCLRRELLSRFNIVGKFQINLNKNNRIVIVESEHKHMVMVTNGL